MKVGQLAGNYLPSTGLMSLYLVCVCGYCYFLFDVFIVCMCVCMYACCACMCVCLQVVVESGVVPKLVPLLSSDENKIVVC